MGRETNEEKFDRIKAIIGEGSNADFNEQIFKIRRITHGDQ